MKPLETPLARDLDAVAHDLAALSTMQAISLALFLCALPVLVFIVGLLANH